MYPFPRRHWKMFCTNRRDDNSDLGIGNRRSNTEEMKEVSGIEWRESPGWQLCSRHVTVHLKRKGLTSGELLALKCQLRLQYLCKTWGQMTPMSWARVLWLLGLSWPCATSVPALSSSPAAWITLPFKSGICFDLLLRGEVDHGELRSGEYSPLPGPYSC